MSRHCLVLLLAVVAVFVLSSGKQCSGSLKGKTSIHNCCNSWNGKCFSTNESGDPAYSCRHNYKPTENIYCFTGKAKKNDLSNMKTLEGMELIHCEAISRSTLCRNARLRRRCRTRSAALCVWQQFNNQSEGMELIRCGLLSRNEICRNAHYRRRCRGRASFLCGFQNHQNLESDQSTVDGAENIVNGQLCNTMDLSRLCSTTGRYQCGSIAASRCKPKPTFCERLPHAAICHTFQYRRQCAQRAAAICGRRINDYQSMSVGVAGIGLIGFGGLIYYHFSQKKNQKKDDLNDFDGQQTLF